MTSAKNTILEKAEIMQNTGLMAFGDIATKTVAQIGDSSSTVDTYTFLSDKASDERVCVAKRTVELGTLQDSHQIADSEGELQTVLTYSTSQTILHNEVKIDVDGLAFNSDNGSITFGTLGEFRLRYDESSDTVQIQSLDAASNQSVTKREFGR